MGRGRFNTNDTRLVHHTLQASAGGPAEVSLKLTMDNLITDTGNTTNPCIPRAARLVRAAVHGACLAVNTAGDWTLRIRKNESGSDSATMTFGLAAVPGTKTAGLLTPEVIWEAGETYHGVVDGPSRNFVIVRVTLEWEVL